MYAFRKPFTAGKFADTTLWGVDYKTVLVTAQVLGYTISKFVGIKVVSELTPARRAGGILILIGIAECALILFGLTPAPYNFAFLLLNGLPLGMVFGLVVGFLEGRQKTEALAAGLCASFVLADGVVKSVGTAVINVGISEYWMPAVVGLIFMTPLLVFVWMLARIPPPTETDVSARSERSTMTSGDRWRLFGKYAVGLSLLIAAYLMITVLRTIRADFAPEIWKSLGQTAAPGLYARSEFLVALGVTLSAGLTVLIRDNRRAFSVALAVSVGGVLLIAAALSALSAGVISPFVFMVSIGVGIYMPYVAIHTTVFERFLAVTREKGSVAYLMTLADAFGYLGFVGVMVGKNMGADRGFGAFFIATSWAIVIATGSCLALAWFYFMRKTAVSAPSGAHAHAAVLPLRSGAGAG